jgi:hypothetical protein
MPIMLTVMDNRYPATIFVLASVFALVSAIICTNTSTWQTIVAVAVGLLVVSLAALHDLKRQKSQVPENTLQEYQGDVLHASPR